MDKYVIDALFEREVVYHCVFSKNIFATLDKVIEIEAFVSPEAVFVIGLCKLYFDRTSQAFETFSAIRQEILTLCKQAGKITIDQAYAYSEYVANTMDDPRRKPEIVLEQFKTIMEPRIKLKGIESALKGESRQKVIEQLSRLDKVGILVAGVGEQLDASMFAKIAALRSTSRIATGCSELDAFLRGGLPKRTVTTFLGSAGDGKSMILSQLVIRAVMRDEIALYASNEMPIPELGARMFGDMTDIPYLEIVEGNDFEARKRFAQRQAKVPNGKLFLKYLLEGKCTVGDIRLWVKEVKQQTGRPVSVLSIDYGDKLTIEQVLKNMANTDLYKQVWEEMVALAEEEDCVIAVGSQAKDKGTAQFYDKSHFCQSAWKPRLSQQWITLNKTPKGFYFNVAKNRSGQEGTVGPVVTEQQFGRLTSCTGMGAPQMHSPVPGFNAPSVIQLPGRTP
jgi:RecA/RadA recombinase